MKYLVNLRVTTFSGVTVEPYAVTAGNVKSAQAIAAVEAIRRHGRENIVEISAVSAEEVKSRETA